VTVYLVDEAHFEIAEAYATMDKSARIVLLQDAVYASIAGKVRGDAYALEDDVSRRGLKGRVPPSVKVIGYSDLVQMMENERVVNFL
jgi:sulfur relay protein TusB/DsrH